MLERSGSGCLLVKDLNLIFSPNDLRTVDNAAVTERHLCKAEETVQGTRNDFFFLTWRRYLSS